MFKRFGQICLSIGLALGMLFAGAWALQGAQAAPEATLVVTTTADSGVGSLRQAIADANSNPGADTISFNLSNCPCLIALTSALPTITDSLTLSGPGAEMLALDGGDLVRVLEIGNIPVAVSEVTVQNGYANGLGGGISSYGPLTLTNVAVLSNTANSGGGVAVQEEDVVVMGGRFQNNLSQIGGGGLYVLGGPSLANRVSLSSVEFMSNTALVGGGALVARGALQVTDSLFSNNHCTNTGCQGGAMHGDGPIALTGTQFINNTAAGMGGGAYVSGTTALVDTLFQNNVSFNEHGGGLALAGGGLTMSAAQFVGNSAQGYGGGVYALATLTAQDSLFQENNSATGGGGLQATNLRLTDTHFISNTAPSGGGVRVPNATLTGGLFQGNVSTSGNGGGLQVTSGGLTVSGTQFLNNTAQGSGGGAFATGQATVTGGRFQANQSQAAPGGGLYAGSAVQLTDTQFIRNSATEGGGVYHASAASGRMVNVLLGGNSALSGQGAALYVGGASAWQILHTTIASPTQTNAAAIYVVNGQVGITDTIIVSHSLGINNAGGSVFENANLFYGNGADFVGAVTSGGQSLTGAPAFVDAGADDYHLAPASLAVNRGLEVGVTTDFEGEARPQQGTSDVGFDESPYTQTVPIAGLSITSNPTTTVNVPMTFTASITAGTNETYSWSVDGVEAGSGNVLTYTFMTTGTPSVMVTATNSLGSLTATKVITVVAAPYIPITGLIISVDPLTPTVGAPMTFTASITTGTNVAYTWSMNGQFAGSGNPLSYLFTTAGTYSVTVTATNSVSVLTSDVVVVITQRLYLPLLVR